MSGQSGGIVRCDICGSHLSRYVHVRHFGWRRIYDLRKRPPAVYWCIKCGDRGPIPQTGRSDG